MDSMIIAAMMSDSALPKLQFPAVRNSVSMMLPMSTYDPPPSSLGMKNAETDGRNTSVMPEIMPGRHS